MFKNRLAVNIFFGVNGFLFAGYISRLPAIQRVYGLDNGGIGMLLLFAAIGALFAMPFTGWLIVGNGSRRISALAGILFCLLVPLIGLMPNVEQAHRRPVMSSFHAIFSAGMMIGAGCGALFTNFQAGLAAHLGSVSALGIALIFWAIQHLMRDGRHAEAAGQSRFRLPDASLVGID